jgi:hypothetical protein
LPSSPGPSKTKVRLRRAPPKSLSARPAGILIGDSVTPGAAPHTGLRFPGRTVPGDLRCSERCRGESRACFSTAIAMVERARPVPAYDRWPTATSCARSTRFCIPTVGASSLLRDGRAVEPFARVSCQAAEMARSPSALAVGASAPVGVSARVAPPTRSLTLSGQSDQTGVWRPGPGRPGKLTGRRQSPHWAGRASGRGRNDWRATGSTTSSQPARMVSSPPRACCASARATPSPADSRPGWRSGAGRPSSPRQPPPGGTIAIEGRIFTVRVEAIDSTTGPRSRSGSRRRTVSSPGCGGPQNLSRCPRPVRASGVRFVAEFARPRGLSLAFANGPGVPGWRSGPERECRGPLGTALPHLVATLLPFRSGSGGLCGVGRATGG